MRNKEELIVLYKQIEKKMISHFDHLKEKYFDEFEGLSDENLSYKISESTLLTRYGFRVNVDGNTLSFASLNCGTSILLKDSKKYNDVWGYCAFQLETACVDSLNNEVYLSNLNKVLEHIGEGIT